MVNDVIGYSPDAGQNIPRGQLQIGDLVAAIYTIIPYTERALVELAHAEFHPLQPQILYRSHGSVSNCGQHGQGLVKAWESFVAWRPIDVGGSC